MMKIPFKTLGLWSALLLCTSGTVLSANAAGGRSSTDISRPAQRENQAAITLLENAAQDLDAGQLDQAAADLERALRIEPGNAAIWHYLGQTRLHQGQYQEAEALAAKSNTLAGNDAALRARNTWLANAAQQAAGQNLSPMINDSERLALQQRLDEEIERRRQAEAQTAILHERLKQERAQPAVPEWSQGVRLPERSANGFGERASRHDMQETALGASHERDAGEIPNGHRPPPGQCRIWFPDRPPGHQPPPGDCRALERRLPAGAWLVRS